MAFQGLGCGMGTEDIDLEMIFELKLPAGIVDLSRWKLTDGPGGCCHPCRILWRHGRLYRSHGPYQPLFVRFEHCGHLSGWRLKKLAKSI